MMDTWIRCDDSLPLNGDLVETKVDDADGCRNVQKLRRKDGLWFTSYNMYVCYTPTHWRPLNHGVPA
jgi:hypothetical protein